MCVGWISWLPIQHYQSRASLSFLWTTCTAACLRVLLHSNVCVAFISLSDIACVFDASVGVVFLSFLTDDSLPPPYTSTLPEGRSYTSLCARKDHKRHVPPPPPFSDSCRPHGVQPPPPVWTNAVWWRGTKVPEECIESEKSSSLPLQLAATLQFLLQ